MKKRFGAFLCIIVLLSMLTVFTSACSGSDGYKITFYDGENVIETITTKGKEAITLPTEPAKVGYTFGGFYLDKAFATQITADTFKDKKLEAEISVYTKWTANTYEITFDIAGGVGEVAKATAVYNSAMPTLLSSAPTKVGYAFGGFYDKATGLVKYYNADLTSAKTFDKTEAVALVAVWVASENTVTFNANSGVGENYSQTIKSDTTAALTANTFTKTGYTFAGWATEATGAMVYADGANYTMSTASVTLYAVWTASGNTVTFNANSGVGENYSQTINSDTTAALTANTFTKTGYTFAGWATTATSDVLYNDKENYKMGTASVTLYAKWTANTYEITFDIAGGVGAVANVTATYDSVMPTLSSSAPTKVGYTFDGFYDNAGGKKYYNADLTSANTFDKAAATTLVAVWVAFNYTVNFEYDGATGNNTTQNMQIKYNASFTCPVPTKTNYAFQGWYKGETQCTDANGASILTSYTEANGATLTFTAKWTDVTGMTFVENARYAALTGYTGTATNVVIPTFYNGKPVSEIGKQAFMKKTSIKTITIPNSVKTIGNYAFYNCLSLTSIKIPASVTAIGEGAFSLCSALVSIIVEDGNKFYSGAGNCLVENATKKLISGCNKSVIPAGVEIIGTSAFNSSIELTAITIPASVTTIMRYAFIGCTKLATVTIVTNSLLDRIEDRAFSGCNALKTFYIPKGVTVLGAGETSPFYGTDIETFTVEDGNPKFRVTNNCLIDIPNKKLIVGCKGSTIPTDGSVTTIGCGAFVRCLWLTTIVIPSNITSIGKEAFYGCSNLTSVTLSEGLTTIEANAFGTCSTLTSITLPASLTTIEYYAFYNCVKLPSITIPASVTKIGDSAFIGCTALTNIDVVEGNQNYKSVDGNLYTKDGTKLIQYALGKTAESFTIPAGVTTIGANAFEGCKLKSVIIPANVTTIGNAAFYNCYGLTSVTLSEGLITIGENVFSNSYNITSITIPKTVTTIGANAFYNWTSKSTINCYPSSKPEGWDANWLGDCKATVVWNYVK